MFPFLLVGVGVCLCMGVCVFSNRVLMPDSWACLTPRLSCSNLLALGCQPSLGVRKKDP